MEATFITKKGVQPVATAVRSSLAVKIAILMPHLAQRARKATTHGVKPMLRAKL